MANHSFSTRPRGRSTCQSYSPRSSTLWSRYVPIECSATQTKVFQTFFVNRVRVLSGRWLISTTCWAFTLVRAGLAKSAFALTWNFPRWSEFAAQFPWFLASVLAIGGSIDVLVAASQCYYLWQMRAGGAQRCVQLIQSLGELDNMPLSTREMVETIVAWTIGEDVTSITPWVIIDVPFNLIRDWSNNEVSSLAAPASVSRAQWAICTVDAVWWF
jgi:hypothetical protein